MESPLQPSVGTTRLGTDPRFTSNVMRVSNRVETDAVVTGALVRARPG